MSTKLFSLKPLCLAALLFASAAANAEIKIYTSQGDFLAAVSNPGTDTYDDLTIASLGLSVGRSAGAYSYTASSPNGLWGAGGPGNYWLSTTTATDPLVFDHFSAGVNAFGGFFFASDIGGQYVPSGELVLGAADGSTVAYTLTGATQNSFVGFVSDSALTSVVLLNATNGVYWPTANNVVLAAVPEPATYGMFLAGLGFVGVMARRRR